MGILEKISEIEKEIARTQKNKGMQLRISFQIILTKKVKKNLTFTVWKLTFIKEKWFNQKVRI